MAKIEFEDPESYSKDNPIHMAIYAQNGVGKTTFAGKTNFKTVFLDCSDAGAVTLRKLDKKRVKIIRIKTIMHYLDVIEELIRKADSFDLLVPDTISGLQSLAIREVKGKKNFEMNQRKWGQVSARVIECLAETRNFPKNVIYLVQQKEKNRPGESDVTEISPGLTPSTMGYLSSIVDWVGQLSVDSEGQRMIDFRITSTLEVKDRAGLFPKPIINPTYDAIHKRIVQVLHEGKEPEPIEGEVDDLEDALPEQQVEGEELQ